MHDTVIPVPVPGNLGSAIELDALQNCIVIVPEPITFSASRRLEATKNVIGAANSEIGSMYTIILY